MENKHDCKVGPRSEAPIRGFPHRFGDYAGRAITAVAMMLASVVVVALMVLLAVIHFNSPSADAFAGILLEVVDNLFVPVVSIGIAAVGIVVITIVDVAICETGKRRWIWIGLVLSVNVAAAAVYWLVQAYKGLAHRGIGAWGQPRPGQSVLSTRVSNPRSDELRRREERNLAAAAVNYLWNPINDNIIEEFDDAGNTIAEYTTEPDLYGSVVSQFRDGQTSYVLSDGQGNTTELTNDAGNVTDTVRYSAFGQVTHRTGTTEIPFQFVGQKGYFWDDLAKVYSVRRRRLSPESRWHSVDPISLLEMTRNGIRYVTSGYVYVENRPLSDQDPSGLLLIRVIQPARAPLGCPRDVRVQSATMKLQFTLDRVKGCEGYLVQAVTYFCRIQFDCRKCPCERELFAVKTFYEAWHVSKDSAFADWETNLEAPKDHTDWPRKQVFPDSCGETGSIGVVKFFCKDKTAPDSGGVETGDLDAAWKKDQTWGITPCQMPAPEIPSTDQRPMWWDQKPVEGPALNYFVTTWNCCPRRDDVFAAGGVIPVGFLKDWLGLPFGGST